MKLSIIVAMSQNAVIGNTGSLPWHLPEDLKYFKQTTLNHPILMGRKTFTSIGKALPERQSIVLTHNPNWKAPDTIVIHELSELQKINLIDEEVFAIGGAEIYKLCYPQANKLFITLIDQNIFGDTFFPFPDWKKDFKLIKQSEKMLSTKQNLHYQFLYLERNK